MLIHGWDASLGEDEWRAFVQAQGFGHLIATGRGRDVPVVVPTQFLLEGDVVMLHLARPNPIWEAVDENPMVMLSVAGDWAYIRSSWKAIDGEDPRLGIPTTYYGAAQLVGRATVVDDVGEVAAILRAQLEDLQSDEDVADPSEHGAKLRSIRGLRIAITEVRAKMKYGGNVDHAHRQAVAERLRERGGPGDVAAASHIVRRTPSASDRLG